MSKEFAYAMVHAVVMDTLNIAAPGLSQQIKNGIATSVALKLRSKINNIKGDEDVLQR